MTPFDENRHGSLQQQNGNVEVIFNRHFNHSIEKVWQAITNPDDLNVWFPGLSFELKLGGQFEIWFGGKCEGPAHVTGVVEELDPPNRLRLGSMCFDLAATDTGCTLTFSDVLWFDDRPKTDFAISVLGGWHSYMDSLCTFIEGQHTGVQPPEPAYANISVPGWDLLF